MGSLKDFGNVPGFKYPCLLLNSFLTFRSYTIKNTVFLPTECKNLSSLNKETENVLGYTKYTMSLLCFVPPEFLLFQRNDVLIRGRAAMVRFLPWMPLLEDCRLIGTTLQKMSSSFTLHRRKNRLRNQKIRIFTDR